MLEITALSAAYGAVTALTEVTLSVGRGEIVSLLGSNGAGKSTLVGCVTNSVPATMTGSIRLDGTEMLGISTYAIIRRGLVLVPEGRQLFSGLTVQENLRVGTHAFGMGHRWTTELDTVYGLFPRLAERRNQVAATLSGGEQQMVAIGRALMAKPSVMLLDEPSLGLAPLLVAQIFELIQKINQQGVTILLIEQNVRQALRIANRGYVLEKGRISTGGSAADLMGNPQVVEAYLG